MRQPSRSRGQALLLAWAVTVIWGSSFVLIKLGLADIPPLTFAAYRYTFGGLILGIVVLAMRRKLAPDLGHAPPRLIAASGLAAYTIGQGLFYVGQVQVSALTGSFFYSLAPVFVLILSVLYLRIRPRPVQLAGLAVVVLGMLLFYPPALALAQWKGVLLLIASNLGTSYYLILVRRIRLQSSIAPAWLTALALLCGGGCLLPLALIIEGFILLSFRSWLLILWLALVNSALAYTLWNLVLDRLPPFELSVVGNLIPLNTALISGLLFSTPLSWREILGLLIVLTGIIVVQGGTQPVQAEPHPLHPKL